MRNSEKCKELLVKIGYVNDLQTDPRRPHLRGAESDPIRCLLGVWSHLDADYLETVYNFQQGRADLAHKTVFGHWRFGSL